MWETLLPTLAKSLVHGRNQRQQQITQALSPFNAQQQQFSQADSRAQALDSLNWRNI
jgi:hypothetical protein